jgi:hypothetical protein
MPFFLPDGSRQLGQIVWLENEPLKFSKSSNLVRDRVELVFFEVENPKSMELADTGGQLTQAIIGQYQDL